MADVPVKAIRNPSWAIPGQLALLNGVQFAVRTHAQGGASFNTSTNKFLNVGEDKTYVVGGEPDTKGERIPTVPVESVDIPTALEHMDRVRRLTGHRPDAIAGSWVQPDRVDLDASGAIANRRQALKTGEARNEEAIWDNEAGEDILTKVGKAKKRAKGKQS